MRILARTLRRHQLKAIKQPFLLRHQIVEGLAEGAGGVVLAVLPGEGAEQAFVFDELDSPANGFSVFVAGVHDFGGVAEVYALALLVPYADVVSDHALTLGGAFFKRLAGNGVGYGRRVHVPVAMAVEAYAEIHPVVGNALIVELLYAVCGSPAVGESGTFVQR